jgi:hypothetical protein
MRTFRKLGFDIAYLALLTKDHIKPLSRWEGKFSRRQIKALRHLGLKTDTVDRKLINGGAISELIFSTSWHYLDVYIRKYHRTPIKKDRQTVKAEGFLFGYPSCCVQNFAENGYTRNEFEGRGQEILLHWACPGCRATPQLLPYYRRTHDRCRELLATEKSSAHERIKQSLPAASLALLFALVPGRARADDPHWYSPSAIDTTGDFLVDREELLLGTLFGELSSDLPSGPREALEFNAIINSLPDTCCSIEWLIAEGDENCQVCGQAINMGFVSIHNYRRDLLIQIPIIALHYLEHGSFSYDGTEHSGRIDIELLKRILDYRDTDHYAIETANDADGDGLGDDQESHFGTLPGDADSDDNRLVDGAQVAEGIIMAISQLPVIEDPTQTPDDTPYIIYQPAYGIVTCDICGMTVNMGFIVIVNPLADTSMQISFPGLHYLAHGRFAHSADGHVGEIDAVELATVLDIPTWTPQEHPQPREFQLFLRNYPNPFNVGTQIAFSVPETDRVLLRIYNIKGQLVRTLIDKTISGGHHRIGWNGRANDGAPVASGVYFCRLELAGRLRTTKMLLLK